MSEILCNDCLDTGWIEDREGRSVCSCISETDPYQQLQVEVERLREHHKIAVDNWTLEAQNVKVLEEENERLRNLTASMQDWSAEKDAMVAELHEQCDEIKRFRAEILAHMTHIAQLQGEYDARQLDAERYRTIRRMIRDGMPPFDNDYYDEAELDAAIDKVLREHRNAD